jgi:O-methyltransferase
MMDTRELYLDLLVRILTNTIYGDPSNNPANAGPFQAELRSGGLDWPAVAHTMVGVHRLQNLRELTQRAIDDDIPGDFIETGVWRGGCCILMRAILAANAIRNRKVYVADSFAGLPPPNPEIYPHDQGLDLHVYKELAISLEQVKDNFSRYGLLDDQVVFVKGFFSDTLPSLQAGPFALIRLDGDLYESTYVALEALYPKLSPGGFVIIDDFKLIPACKQAVFDYRGKQGIAFPIRDIDECGVWWRKE